LLISLKHTEPTFTEDANEIARGPVIIVPVTDPEGALREDADASAV